MGKWGYEQHCPSQPGGLKGQSSEEVERQPAPGDSDGTLSLDGHFDLGTP